MVNRNLKRPIETIDLTGDDDVQFVGSRVVKVPRPTNSPAARDLVSQNRDNSGHVLDGERFDLVDLTQDDASLTVEELYGVLSTRIVGVQYYRGFANPGEMVIVEREPQNPYDYNAILVRNVRGDQIGHIPRAMAAKLAPYMDSRSLHVEGVLSGQIGVCDCPIRLKLYGTSDPVLRAELCQKMRRDKLPLGDYTRREHEERERRKAAEVAASQQRQGLGAPVGFDNGIWAGGFGESSGGWFGGSQPFDTLDDIISESQRFNPRNMEEVMEQFGVSDSDLENMPKAEQPKALACNLLPFQLQGLKWLLDKENPQMPPPGSKDVVQLWKRSSVPNTFTHIATNYSQRDPPLLASGGILADDMGLGKTVQVISLLMADRDLKTPRRNGVSEATLILAPLSVMSNWSNQIREHIKPENALRVLTYHGARKVLVDKKEINKFDVVVTTYDTLSSEYYSVPEARRKEPRENGLFSVHWRRVVLDEGHNIRNPVSKRAVAATQLRAKSKWVLTGTPIVNSLKDLYSLVRFLRLSGGLTSFELFNSALIRPVKDGESRGNYLLQSLMGSICLRRKKEMSFINLKLPELSEYVHRIKFLPKEREKYEALQAEARGTLAQYKLDRSNNSVNAQNSYSNLLEVLLRLRQLCNHWKLCGEERISKLLSTLQEKVIDLTPENIATLQQMLQLSIESQEDCPVCLDTLKNPYITSCAHVFCYNCIQRVIETQHKCPLCRTELPDTSKIVSPAEEAKLDPITELDSDESSSKVEALMTILNASRQHPGNKTIVFSQWTSFLDIVQGHLSKLGFKYTRIDGTMSAIQRDAAMATLQHDPECEIMLASLGVCSVGLNLVAANQVVLCDSWWAPAIEDQAVDRVHRLGQTKPTTVFRLVMDDSIEDRVIEIQEAKRKLMALAFAEKASTRKNRAARLADIERLLR